MELTGIIKNISLDQTGEELVKELTLQLEFNGKANQELSQLGINVTDFSFDAAIVPKGAEIKTESFNLSFSGPKSKAVHPFCDFKNIKFASARIKDEGTLGPIVTVNCRVPHSEKFRVWSDNNFRKPIKIIINKIQLDIGDIKK